MPALPGSNCQHHHDINLTPQLSPSLTPGFPLSSKEAGRVVTNVESPDPHLGWHSRGYLPHWDHPGMIQSINFRLADSLPHAVLEKWQNELALKSQPDARRATELRRRIEEYIDAGHGECWLRLPAIARLVEGALLRFDPERYRLLAWCIMPNHVHVLIQTMERRPLADILHSWKSYSSSQANKLLTRSGEFWQREYLDRYVRNAGHYQAVVAYIEENPVNAGLVKVKTEWPWSSARFRVALGTPGSAGIPAGEL